MRRRNVRQQPGPFNDANANANANASANANANANKSNYLERNAGEL